MISRFILFLIFISNLTFPQEFLTPEEAVKIALLNNYSINIAKNEAEIASNNSTPGTAGFLPYLDANGSYLKA
jgi:outer membrane protein